MYIKNTAHLLLDNLDKNQLILRKIGLQALEKSIYAVKPKNLMERSIKIKNSKLIIQKDEFDLSKFKKIYIIGGGKATAEMAASLEGILLNIKDVHYEGIINIPKALETLDMFKKSKISINFASHPIPNEDGLRGTKLMIKIIEKSTKNDLIFVLISGGGSALLPLPKHGISLKDLQDINSLLLSSGASIQEINTIRKHLSDFKGGNLVKKLYNSSGATLISLIISDVVGDDLEFIASGPTVPDKTTFKDALEILKKYELLNKIPQIAREHIEKGILNQKLENPKPNDKCFINIFNYLIGSVASAAQEIRTYLNNKGFKIINFSNNIIGEAREFGKSLYSIISTYIEERSDKYKNEKIALIGTGELTVTIKGTGIGGRNQEMLLNFLNIIKDTTLHYDFLIIGANLDGIEGNSKAMGALIDNYVLEQLISKKIDVEKFLANNDSNSFFKELGTEIITGPTGCNVNDLLLILISRSFSLNK
ncbi:MAG: glycerate kinase [Candidatus Hodarchaeota archaeon]